MKKIFCYVAGLGFLLGLIVHIVSLFEIYLGEKIPFIWALHVGIFIVWLPAVLEFRKIRELKQPGFVNPFKLLGIIFNNAPKFVIILLIVVFFYTTINFLFMAGQGGVPGIMDGKYVIHNRGSIVKELTETEYFKMKAHETLEFSGHWMTFYAVAMGILWPKANKQE